MLLVVIIIMIIRTVTIKFSDNVSHWIYLLSNQNAAVRLAAVHLYINLYKYSLQPGIASALKSSFITSLPVTEPEDSERVSLKCLGVLP